MTQDEHPGATAVAPSADGGEQVRDGGPTTMTGGNGAHPTAGADGAVDAVPEPVPAAVTCSIVIPARNRASQTRQCLNSLLSDVLLPEHEVIVVDDASTDLTPRLLAAYADRVRVVSHASATGPAAARNAGAAVAAGEYLAFLDQDTLPQPGWLATLVRYAEAHPSAAVVGAKLLYPNDTVRHAGIVVGIDRYPHHLYAGFPASHPAVTKSRRFQAVSAAGCLIRRDAWQGIGGFDPAFGEWANVDLCLRLRRAGHQIHLCADSIVYHLALPPREPLATAEVPGRARYDERWRNRVAVDDLGYYVADGLLSASYDAHYPLRLSVSPLLAGLSAGDHERMGDALLAERAQQVATLVQQNIALNLRVHEAELRAQAAEQHTPPPERAIEVPAPAPALPAPPTQAPARPVARPSLAVAKPVRTAATTATQPIIGSVERPQRQGEVVAEGRLTVAGWALSKAGIWSVETLVDGEVRGFVDYGRPRPDVATLHPDIPGAENCGFLGSIPVEDLADGEHGLVIRVTAFDARRAELAARFEIDSTAKASGRILAACDRPGTDGRTVTRDRLTVVGWALAPSGIREVQVLVDGEPRGAVAYGALRPDVALSNPGYPDADHCGFSGSVPVADLEPGEHGLVVRVVAIDGRHHDLPTRFSVEAADAAFGEVPHLNAQYPEWLAKHEPTEAALAEARAEAATLARRPLLGLLVPVGGAQALLLAELLDNLRAQVYDDWELCLAVDPATGADARAVLTAAAEREPRLRITELAEPASVAAAVNAALALAGGELVALLGPGDRLSPLALLEVARALNEAPETDVVYVDEDKHDPERGIRWDPFFKPDWSPDLLLSTPYVGPFTFYRRKLVNDIGGFRPGFEGQEGYDLALRATERTDHIRHVPYLLVSRHADAEIGADPGAAADAARAALAEAVARRGLDAAVEPGTSPGRWRVRYGLAERPGVTVVLPTGGKLRFLRPCLDDLLAKTTYPDLRILVVDNSEGEEVGALCRELAAAYPTASVRHEPFALKPFNFSAIINHAIPLVETPYLILLNDDVTIVTPDWVEAMLEHAQRPGVGAVGAKLLFPDDTIQHAGVILGPYDGTGHAFKQFPGDEPGYFGLPNVVRNWSAVTFACAMLRRDVLDEVGLLDAERLPIAFNDVDLCLRIGEAGYRVVYTPHAVLYHHESVTKKVIAAPSEIAHLRTRWGHLIEHDPFYNPNLTRRAEDCSLNME